MARLRRTGRLTSLQVDKPKPSKENATKLLRLREDNVNQAMSSPPHAGTPLQPATHKPRSTPKLGDPPPQPGSRVDVLAAQLREMMQSEHFVKKMKPVIAAVLGQASEQAKQEICTAGRAKPRTFRYGVWVCEPGLVVAGPRALPARRRKSRRLREGVGAEAASEGLEMAATQGRGELEAARESLQPQGSANPGDSSLGMPKDTAMPPPYAIKPGTSASSGIATPSPGAAPRDSRPLQPPNSLQPNPPPPSSSASALHIIMQETFKPVQRSVRVAECPTLDEARRVFAKVKEDIGAREILVRGSTTRRSVKTRVVIREWSDGLGFDAVLNGELVTRIWIVEEAS